MKKHLLLVDDDRSFRRSLMIQLEIEDYRVTPMESAFLALEFLDECKTDGDYPDLVITDVKMDEMDGAAFIRILEDQYPDLEVLVISAYELPESLKGYAFLKKPFKFAVLNEKICRTRKKMESGKGLE